MAIFHLGAIFDASEGKGLTFIATFPWLECLIVLWLSFLFYPLPHHRHLSSFARPPPTPLSSFGFWLGWRNLWTAPNDGTSLLSFVVRFEQLQHRHSYQYRFVEEWLGNKKAKRQGWTTPYTPDCGARISKPILLEASLRSQFIMGEGKHT